jgi:hypothetical protein
MTFYTSEQTQKSSVEVLVTIRDEGDSWFAARLKSMAPLFALAG